MLAPDWRPDYKCCKCLHFLAVHHGGQCSWRRQEWRNYVIVTLCICICACLILRSIVRELAQSFRNPASRCPNLMNVMLLCYHWQFFKNDKYEADIGQR